MTFSLTTPGEEYLEVWFSLGYSVCRNYTFHTHKLVGEVMHMFVHSKQIYFPCTHPHRLVSLSSSIKYTYTCKLHDVYHVRGLMELRCDHSGKESHSLQGWSLANPSIPLQCSGYDNPDPILMKSSIVWPVRPQLYWFQGQLADQLLDQAHTCMSYKLAALYIVKLKDLSTSSA